MTITEIRRRGDVDGVKAPVSQSIHAIPGNTTLDELTEFAWKDLSTPDNTIGAYRLVPLADDPDVWEQLGSLTYARFVDAGAFAAVYSGGHWLPLSRGQWLVRTHDHDLIVVSDADLRLGYEVLGREERTETSSTGSPG